MGRYKTTRYFALLAAGTFIMAVISFSGLFFFREDLTGRLITGLTWSLVTLGWLGQYFRLKSNSGK